MTFSTDRYVKAFMKLFRGREDTIAIQLLNGEYRPRHHPLRPDDVINHLIKVVETYSLYLLTHDDCVYMSCIDIDVSITKLEKYRSEMGEKGVLKVFDILKGDVKKHAEKLEEIGFPYIIEYSGRRGYHIWFFYKSSIPASYALKIRDLVMVKKDARIMDEDGDEFYEFFPKQSSVDERGLGNPIKLPLGKHRLSGNYSYLIDPITFEPIKNPLETIMWFSENGRVKVDWVEKVLGEKIEYSEIIDSQGKRVRKPSKQHMANRFDIEVPSLDVCKETVDEMVSIVNRPPEKNHRIDMENINSCPPCIYRAYIQSRVVGSQFEARQLLVRFFANIKDGGHYRFTPSDIAAFFKYHINDEDDNKHPDLLSYYVSFSYGEIGDPLSLEGCIKIQQKGFCINFNYIKAPKIDEDKIEASRRKIKEGISQIRENYGERKTTISHMEDYSNIDVNESIIAVLRDQTNSIANEIEEELKEIKKRYKIICERIWHPLSLNNQYDVIRSSIKKYEIEDIEDEGYNLTSGKEKKGEKGEKSKKRKKKGRKNEFEENDEEPEPLKSEEDEEDSDDDADIYKSVRRKLQCEDKSNFREINKKSLDLLIRAISSRIPTIFEATKSTRIGATTSLTLTSKLLGSKVLLLEPTNAIGTDTFSKTVKISEKESNLYGEPIYGGVFGANATMCLKVYEKINEELPKKFGKPANELAVNDLPFIFKHTCVKNKKDGTQDICPYYNCIHIGFPDDSGGFKTPVIESKIMKRDNSPWCLKLHIPTESSNSCLQPTISKLKVGTQCKNCNYFRQKHDYIVANGRPICSYATVFRHIVQDVVNIRVINSSYIETKEFLKNKSEKMIIISSNELKDLIDSGFVSDNCRFQTENGDIIDGSVYDESGYVRKDISVIYDVRLKMFDILAMTYNKIIALHKSRDAGFMYESTSQSDQIIDAIKGKNGFNGVICDEVSRLVAQSPMQLSLYNVMRIPDVLSGVGESTQTEDVFIKIEDEIKKLGKYIVFNDETPEISDVGYFNILFTRFRMMFLNVKDWIINPSEIVQMADDYSSYEEIMKDIQRNRIPSGIKKYIKTMQEKGVLDGGKGKYGMIYNRNKVRYIPVCNTRMSMVRTASKLNKYYADNYQKNNDDYDELLKSINECQYTDSDKASNTEIKDDAEYNDILSGYMEMYYSLKIHDDEVAIVDEIIFGFSDGVYDINGGEYVEPFQSYVEFAKPLKFIVLGWARINCSVFLSCFEDEGMTKRDIQQKFIKLYNTISKITFEQNERFPNLIKMLLISNEENLFINSYSTMDYVTNIILQNTPSFDNIIDLSLDVLSRKNSDNSSNFIVVTDATMPLIEMSSLFHKNGVLTPIEVVKFGDPKNNCKKQIIISDNKSVNATDLYAQSIYINDVDDGDRDIGSLNRNKYHIIKTDSEGNPTKYADISKHLTRFRLFLFINKVTEKYGEENVFVISPNKSFDYILNNGMSRGGSGIPLDPLFIDWITINYKADFDECVEKGWIVEHRLNSLDDSVTHCFHITPIGLYGDGDKQYYRGNKTIGTESKCRIMIAITPPSSPINSNEWLAHFYYSRNLTNDPKSRIGCMTIPELGMALRKSELQSAAFQTFSRVKDPFAKDPSVVFAWGFNYNEYKWAKCAHCNIDEITLYNLPENVERSFYDSELQIKTDEIYHCSYQIGDEVVSGDLCFRCIKALKASVVGVSEKQIKNYTSDPEGISDYMAFKIPTPMVVPVLSQNYKTTHVNTHFFCVEDEMLKIADSHFNGKVLPSTLIRKIEKFVTLKTMEKIKEMGVSYKDIDEKLIEDSLTFSIRDIPLWKKHGGKNIRYRGEEVISKFREVGDDVLKDVNVECIEVKNKDSCLFRVSDFSKLEKDIDAYNESADVAFEMD